MKVWKRTNYCLSMAAAMVLVCGLVVFAQAPAPAAQAVPAPAQAATPSTPAPAATAPVMDMPLDLKAAATPSADEMAKGDPGGIKTGTANDVVAADTKKGLTLADLVNQAGQNRIAINFVWTLITGFLVMFMQAGFAIVETGLTRAKNANHTMMMNFMVYGFGLFAFWVCGFAIQMGGVGPYTTLGGGAGMNGEYSISVLGKTFGLWGTHGFFLSHAGAYDVAVMVMFLFQMVFMDTALTIVTGLRGALEVCGIPLSSVFMGALTYPLFANWAWGGGWLAQLGTNYGLGHGYADFAGSGVVHSVGGVTALALAMIIGPRIGKYTRSGKPTPFRDTISSSC